MSYGENLIIYSPSATTTFARCPQMWQFYREGWQPKHIGRLQIAGAYVIGFAKAMEELFRMYPYHISSNIEYATHVGIDIAQRSIQKFLDAGGVIGNDGQNVHLIPERLTKAILNFVKKWQKPSDWHSFIPELTFPEHGNCRVDLLCQSDYGPCIIDFKTKLTRPQEYRLAQDVAAYEYSWQFYHYIWAARSMNIAVESFAVIVVTFEPFSITQEQWIVDEDYLAQWIESAEYWWMLMDCAKETNNYVMATDHSDKYGLCRYAETCLGTDRLNPDRWERNMIYVPRD